METLKRVKKVLMNREKAIKSMAKKLDKVNSLNRTLLDALITAIGRDEVLSFEERKAISTETNDLCQDIDAYMISLDRDINPASLHHLECANSAIEQE